MPGRFDTENLSCSYGIIIRKGQSQISIWSWIYCHESNDRQRSQKQPTAGRWVCCHLSNPLVAWQAPFCHSPSYSLILVDTGMQMNKSRVFDSLLSKMSPASDTIEPFTDKIVTTYLLRYHQCISSYISLKFQLNMGWISEALRTEPNKWLPIFSFPSSVCCTSSPSLNHSPSLSAYAWFLNADQLFRRRYTAWESKSFQQYYRKSCYILLHTFSKTEWCSQILNRQKLNLLWPVMHQCCSYKQELTQSS